MSITEQVHDFWNLRSCGTDRTHAPKYSRQYFEELEKFRYDHEPFIRDFAQFRAWQGRKVLEVGYGAGTDFLEFARSGAELYGIDLTEEARENAVRRLDVYGLTAREVRIGDAERLPFEDGQFDLVYSWGVIHHANNTEACVREIARVCKPGAAVKVMVYNYNSLDAWVCALRAGSLDRRKSLWNHMESVGTKSFRRSDAVAMMGRSGLIVRQVGFAQQLVRKGARYEAPRRLLRRILPARWGWYMMIEAQRS